MNTATFPSAAARGSAPSRHRLRSAPERFIAWRVEPHLHAIDPAGLEALQHAAQGFAAFWRRCYLRAGEIATRLSNGRPIVSS